MMTAKRAMRIPVRTESSSNAGYVYRGTHHTEKYCEVCVSGDTSRRNGRAR